MIYQPNYVGKEGRRMMEEGGGCKRKEKGKQWGKEEQSRPLMCHRGGGGECLEIFCCF